MFTGFDAGDANLFRYCGGDPVNGSDPFGLAGEDKGQTDEYGPYSDNNRVWVTGTEIPQDPFAHETLELWRNSSPLSDNYSSLLNDDRIRLDNVPYTENNYGPHGGSLPKDFIDHSQDLSPLQAVLVGTILFAHGEYRGNLLARTAIRARAAAVIGRTADLRNLARGEQSLLSRLPNLGNPRANWRQNSGVLREEMNLGLPIRDASPGDTGGTFLNAERYLLLERGWTFDPGTNVWMPPTR